MTFLILNIWRSPAAEEDKRLYLVEFSMRLSSLNSPSFGH